jgi:DNA polymerase III alpha subunit
MFGALEFSDKLASAGIHRSSAARSPSISATRKRATRARREKYSAVLLATHEDGYRNLMP